ncbi:MAG TPA: hypothetical protein VK007_01010 [Acidimicrobiales bacterium]|nr:hypothetical protein [Acidimicrobiales bacterium]
MGVAPNADGSRDERSNLEKLDDLQAAHPFPYNLVVGLLIVVVLYPFLRLHPVLLVAYALAYAGLRWYLWQPGRLLHRQYEARAIRWKQTQAERRRRRAGG